MARGPDEVQARAWTIRSVALRTRDGQARLDQAYRRLLSAGSPDPLVPISTVGHAASRERRRLWPEEVSDARGHLCTGVHRAAGAPADDREPGDGPPRLGPRPRS